MFIFGLIFLLLSPLYVGVVVEGFAPEPIETPIIEYVNIEEFNKIDRKIGLSLNREDVDVNDEGEIVRARDELFKKTYRIGKEKGDIEAEEYLKVRKEYLKGVRLKNKYYNWGMYGTFIVYFIIMIGKKIENKRFS